MHPTILHVSLPDLAVYTNGLDGSRGALTKARNNALERVRQIGLLLETASKHMQSQSPSATRKISNGYERAQQVTYLAFTGRYVPRIAEVRAKKLQLLDEETFRLYREFFSALVQEHLDGNPQRLLIPVQRAPGEISSRLYREIYQSEPNWLKSGFYVHNMNGMTFVSMNVDVQAEGDDLKLSSSSRLKKIKDYAEILEQIKEHLRGSAGDYSMYTPSILLASRPMRLREKDQLNNKAERKHAGDRYDAIIEIRRICYGLFDVVMFSDTDTGASFFAPSTEGHVVCALGVGPVEEQCANLLAMSPPRSSRSWERSIDLKIHNGQDRSFHSLGLSIPMKKGCPGNEYSSYASDSGAAAARYDKRCPVTIKEAWDDTASLVGELFESPRPVQALIRNAGEFWPTILDRWPRRSEELTPARDPEGQESDDYCHGASEDVPSTVSDLGVFLQTFKIKEYLYPADLNDPDSKVVVKSSKLREEISRALQPEHRFLCPNRTKPENESGPRSCFVLTSDETFLVITDWGWLEQKIVDSGRDDGNVLHANWEQLGKVAKGLGIKVLVLYEPDQYWKVKKVMSKQALRSERTNALEEAGERYPVGQPVAGIHHAQKLARYYLQQIPFSTFDPSADLIDPRLAAEFFKQAESYFNAQVENEGGILPLARATEGLEEWMRTSAFDAFMDAIERDFYKSEVLCYRSAAELAFVEESSKRSPGHSNGTTTAAGPRQDFPSDPCRELYSRVLREIRERVIADVDENELWALWGKRAEIDLTAQDLWARIGAPRWGRQSDIEIMLEILADKFFVLRKHFPKRRKRQGGLSSPRITTYRVARPLFFLACPPGKEQALLPTEPVAGATFNGFI